MNRPELPDIKGCTDGGCIFGHPGGMHTNGGCACIKEIRPTELRLRFQRNIQMLRAEIRRLRGSEV